jgi:cell fate regulator YaaT (PSP1 superfamily)
MAKEQGLSLNPAKISGSCGRLMCCLAYEQPAYEYLSKITPCAGSTVRTPDGDGVVAEVNLVSGKLRVKVENMPEVMGRWYDRRDCEYLRGGKRAPIVPDPEDKAGFDEE